MSVAHKAPKLRRILLPFALVLAAVACSASGAQASLSENHYANAPLNPGQAYIPSCCVSDPFTTTGNIAYYEGAGTVSVCQMTYDLTSSVYRTGCANNHVGNALNLMPYYGHFLSPGVKNNSPWKHTIHGIAYWGTP